ncbi:MAG: DNA polymerase I [Coraliomargaritaceae bacterium]
MKKLFLLDGMALAYRAHFALIRSPIFNSKGMNTSAAYGFTATLIDLIQKQKPTHLAIAFDTSAPTARHELHPEYKANREAMPEDLSIALPYIETIAQGFNIPIIKMDGYEADDIIGTLAQKAEDDGFDSIFMVTPDKDFGQLVTDKIKMYRPSRKGDGAEVWGIPEILEKWNIQTTKQVIDMLGLCGDVSDNIPGVPGIGPKTAAKLLASYGDVENLLAHTSELKGKQKEQLETYAEQAKLSKELAIINKEVPVVYNWDDYNLNDPSKEQLEGLFSELEFRTLGRRLFGESFQMKKDSEENFSLQSESDSKPKAEALQAEFLPESTSDFKTLKDIPAHYILIKTQADKEALLKAIAESNTFAFDTETDSLDTHNAHLKGIAFVTQTNKGWFLPYNAEDKAFFKDIFSNTTHTKIGHNLKFDISILENHDCPVKGTCYDTLIAHSLIEPEQRHNLDILAENLLQYKTIPFSELVPNAKKGELIDYEKIDIDKLTNYAIEDADITFQLWQILKPQLESLGQSEVFYKIEMPLLPVLIAMEKEGINICETTLKNIGDTLSVEIEKLRNEIYDTAGQEFNLNSPKQLGVILFEVLKLSDKPKKTKTGQYATNEQTLSSLASKHRIAAAILEYRQLNKLVSTYIDALPHSINPKTQHIHTNFGQVQTSTGRLSSNNPNLQNIPIRSTNGKQIRKAFIPRKPDWKILSADYSQIELRILAALSEDPSMIQAFKDKKDIHASTAAKIFEISLEDVTREQRSTAKMVNFGIPYGISAFGLAQRLGTVSRTEAQAIIDNYFQQFPTIQNYIKQQVEKARKDGFVTTLLGRRRYLRDINSSNGSIRAASERNAINMPIQGTAADLIKIAMIRILEKMDEAKLQSKMLLQVHDELIFDLHPEEEVALKKILETEMVHAIDLKCPVEIDIGIGNNWLEAH